ncbi:hypothetical protein RRG08_022361 [Elysia crispata]|uniref:Uncharacterized protein n=1 Tax=Elysia crispata TaxID=231223 RepID=A0AAE0Z189_9GAST|nr:hypothetical protein RRG08_022361 [Elysia crispata]
MSLNKPGSRGVMLTGIGLLCLSNATVMVDSGAAINRPLAVILPHSLRLTLHVINSPSSLPCPHSSTWSGSPLFNPSSLCSDTASFLEDIVSPQHSSVRRGEIVTDGDLEEDITSQSALGLVSLSWERTDNSRDKNDQCSDHRTYNFPSSPNTRDHRSGIGHLEHHLDLCSISKEQTGAATVGGPSGATSTRNEFNCQCGGGAGWSLTCHKPLVRLQLGQPSFSSPPLARHLNTHPPFPTNLNRSGI